MNKLLNLSNNYEKDDYLKIWNFAKEYDHKTFFNEVNNYFNYLYNKDELDEIALHLQICYKKRSRPLYLHGYVLTSALHNYINTNLRHKYLNILEFGTGRGYSSILMAKILESNNQNGKINTIDLIEHHSNVKWNCFDAPNLQYTSRFKMMEKWGDLRDKYINFIEGDYINILKYLNIGQIHFAFVDCALDYNHTLNQLKFIEKNQLVGDIIICDDYTITQFPETCRAIDCFLQQKKYDYKIFFGNDGVKKRGYVYMKKKGNKSLSMLNCYSEYQDYVNKQLEKTSDPERQKLWLGPEWKKKIDIFKYLFKINFDHIHNKKKAICLGSRTGQEVVALKELGIEDSIGIDLHSFEPYTIKGDIHNIDFDDNTFDLAFSNIFDHSLYPNKFASEVFRILSNNGIFILHVGLIIDQDNFSESIVNDKVSITNIFNKFKCIKEGKIRTNIGMNYEFIFKKSVINNDDYLDISNFAKNYDHSLFINEIDKSFGWIYNKQKMDDIALHLQICKKTSRPLYLHGYLISSALQNYIKNSNIDFYNIFETGTARGFSSIILADVLKQNNKKGKIHTLDLYGQFDEIKWNCYNCPLPNKCMRYDLQEKWSDLRDSYINSIKGDSNIILKYFNISRIHFAFLDGAHHFKELLQELEFVEKRQIKDDIIVCDDYTLKQFPEICKAIDYFLSKYNYNSKIFYGDDGTKKRGYVYMIKK